MEKIPSREHDFGAKLRQASVVERLKAYVDWKRGCAAEAAMPEFGPLSINLGEKQVRRIYNKWAKSNR